MRIFALVVTLLLHLSGLWSRLPAQAVSVISSADTGTSTQAVAIRTTPTPPLPVQTGSAPLSLQATGAYAVDTQTGTVLYSQNANTPHPIASITKLVTALVILSRHKPDTTVTIPKLPTYQTADQTLGFMQGEKYTLQDLVDATLVYSADDGADAMALWDAGSIPKFAARMNAKMSEWGIHDAHFSNPSGLVDAGNGASPAAVAKIAELAMASPVIRQAVGESQGSITSAADRTITFISTDDLLAGGQFYGIKTGYTQAAGECFVGLTRISGHEVITVVLGANDRFGATVQLTNWISQNWQWL
jgi:D-alanyl-D-alanine carboxypeptidase (penicillin-binding protein 5/6)